MAQAKIATPKGTLSPNYRESVQQKTDVGDPPIKAIAGVLKEKQTIGRLVPSKYAIIGSDPVRLFDNISNDSRPVPTIDLLTITQTAGLLKVSVSTMRRLQQGRCIPFIKVGGSVRFSKNDIASYLGKHRVESIDQ